MFRPGLSALAVLCLACSALDPGAQGREVDPAGRPRDQTLFQVCEDSPPPSEIATEQWRHWASTLITWAGPWHSGQDVIAVAGADAVLRAKFAYGVLSKDLEDEWVEVWIDRCGELEWLDAARTDSDGRVALTVEADRVPLVGRHRVHFRVAGDGTGTWATLHVLPPATKLAVFDIDGTLTTSDWELVKDLASDVFNPIRHGASPQARAAAADTTRARDEQGYVVVYLTGRPYSLTGRTRDWLHDQATAPGALVTAQRSADALPFESGVGAYKADYLAELELLGFTIELAYGNAATDVFAYDEAGIDVASTFILGRHGGENGTVALGESFEAHLATASKDAIEQPFERDE